MPNWPETSGRIGTRAPTRKHCWGPTPGLYRAADREDRLPQRTALSRQRSHPQMRQSVRNFCMRCCCVNDCWE
eukprot:4590035-Pyramimonas_sp.AAC.2